MEKILTRNLEKNSTLNFQKVGLKVAYSTKYTRGSLLSQRPHRHNQYESSGVYQLTCLDCGKYYVGQTSRPFRTRFKEHTRDYHMGYQKSLYAKHLLMIRFTAWRGEKCLA
jgi:hypothetical protein